ncbi:MAG: PLP-dependent aminotransferase family protein [Rhodobiaceae bacterium]|nr:PLP-dependent aminotransferase family protein [Rhodobiaceae bacterium]
MTFWNSALETGSGATYQRLADAIHTAILDGTLTAGTRLPPHRTLSHELGVSIGTITRAYELAARRGDIDATIGKGTYVRGIEAGAEDDPINLRINLPADIGQGMDLANMLTRRAAAEFLSYIPFGGSEDHKAAGLAYLKLSGVDDIAGDLIVTAGGQHALTTAFLTCTKPGDLILCEPLTFGGFLDLARTTDRRITAIPADDKGIDASAFEDMCERLKPTAAFLMPTAQNPTGTTLPLDRRHTIASTAVKHNVTLIEDGVYDPFNPSPLTPLVSLAPEHTYYISSLSKTLVPGLRVGYLACPPRIRESANELQHLLGMGPALVMANIATELADNGAMERLVLAQRTEMAWRNTLANQALGDIPAKSTVQQMANRDVAAPHYWLPLPQGWSPDSFVAAAEAQKILVSPSAHFAVDIATPHVRLALGAAPSRAALEKCLTSLANLLDRGPPRTSRSV